MFISICQHSLTALDQVHGCGGAEREVAVDRDVQVILRGTAIGLMRPHAWADLAAAQQQTTTQREIDNEQW